MDEDLSALGKKLSDLLSELEDKQSDFAWSSVETNARLLANGLRVKDGRVDNHTVLGTSGLPKTLTSLLQLCLQDAPVPQPQFTGPALEILRVAANLCVDHDENRQQLLDASLPQAILSLLEGYAASVPPPPHSVPLPLAIPHLKVVRTAIGVLLNASIGFEPVKLRLISQEAASTIIKLSTALYPPGAWLSPDAALTEESPQLLEEAWTLRSSLSNWAWRTISELKETKEDSLMQILNTELLATLVQPLALYTPPRPTPTPSSPLDTESFDMLVHADFESFEESCTLIESLSLDVEDVRLSLARGFFSPSEHPGSVPCLKRILDFIEHGEYSHLWQTLTEAEERRKEKEFDMCKAALIKSVVEVSGEERSQDILWDDANDTKPGGDFIFKMVEWIRNYVRASDEGHGSGRDDLVICASLTLGNLARKEKIATALVAQPYSIVSLLVSPQLLSPTIDIKVKHGVIGLLKHLAQSSIQAPEVHTTIGAAGTIQAISNCGIWEDTNDAMADVVQLSAIGAIKHLCSSVVDNTFALVLSSGTAKSGLSHILALVKRTDSVAIRSEGTRVLVNVIRTLWSNVSIASSPVSSGPSPIANGTVESDILFEKHKKRAAAMRVVMSSDCASALANLVARSAKYPLLVNEGVLAMSLLSTQRVGAPFVLTAILVPLQIEFPPVPPTEPPSASTSTNSDVSSPDAATPSTHLGSELPATRLPVDMLVSVLRNVDNPVPFQPEVRMNVCSLLIQLSRNSGGDDLETLKDTMRPVLEKVRDDLQGVSGKEELLLKSVQRVLDSWA